MHSSNDSLSQFIKAVARFIEEKEQRKRNMSHERDLEIQEMRRRWEPGDDMAYWEQTDEEKDFGITPPKPPAFEEYNRFDFMDMD